MGLKTPNLRSKNLMKKIGNYNADRLIDLMDSDELDEWEYNKLFLNSDRVGIKAVLVDIIRE